MLSDEEGFIIGKSQGERAAKNNISPAGWSFGGILLGVGLGLIGTGLAYVGAGSDVAVPTSELLSIKNKSTEYQMGFSNGYSTTGKNINQDAALGGGVFGLCILLILLYTSTQRS